MLIVALLFPPKLTASAEKNQSARGVQREPCFYLDLVHKINIIYF